MSRDSSHTHLHLHSSLHSSHLEEFSRATGPNTSTSGSGLAPDEIYLAPEHQPLNPEDEEDVVPAMHAAFGIQRAAERRRNGERWRDLGLDKLLEGKVEDGGKGGPGAGRVVGKAGAAADGLLEGFRREGAQGGGVVGRTLQTRRTAEGTSGARLRG